MITIIAGLAVLLPFVRENGRFHVCHPRQNPFLFFLRIHLVFSEILHWRYHECVSQDEWEYFSV